jgi:ferredoxin
MSDESVYEKIAAMWRLPGSKGLIRILKNGLTPEEGEIMLGLSNLITPEELAKKLNMDVKTVQAKLDSLSRGWVIPHNGKYITFPDMAGVMPLDNTSFPGVSEEERKAEWLDWFRTEEFQKWQLETWRRMTKVNGGNARYRIQPAHRALAASPNIKPEQILWFEDMQQVFQRATKIYVKACSCRNNWGVCDSPLNNCIGVSYADTPAAELAFRELHWGKIIDAAEAIALIEDAEDRAMLNIPVNQALSRYCSCCPCCCGILYPYLNYGDAITKEATLRPSRYRAVIQKEACSGCQTCVDRCHFDAIEMQKIPNSKKLKANVTPEKCMGCGLCVIKCPQKAITLELIRPPEYIPAESVGDGDKTRERYPNWMTADI